MHLLRTDRLEFPDLRTASPEGLLAVGGDLSLSRLLRAYRSGIFPWTDDPLTWWSPDPRAVFDLTKFKPPTRLRSKLKKGVFEISFDRDFSGVIQACTEPVPGRESTWISPRFIKAYEDLHRGGYAHSVEAWQEGRLVGGVYGVAINGFFAGESMFHRVTDASKVALCHLFDHLKAKGFVLFDTQVLSPLTTRLGAIEIRRREYMTRLQSALQSEAEF